MMQKIKNIYHLFQAIIANLYYGFPSRKIKVIGVTGTDGKTTTTKLIYHILKTSGKKVSMISTVYAIVGNEVYDTGLHTTSPSSFLIQRLLRKAVNQKDEFFVLETTSHGLDQNRDYGVIYQAGAITNITHEHLDYHKTYDNYLKTKSKLLNRSEVQVLNRDDSSYGRLVDIINKKKVFSYGLKNKADINWNKKIKTKLLGSFNRENILAAYTVCLKLGVSIQQIIKAIETFTPPQGRLELVYDKDFKVIIDFAHTPNAIDKALSCVKKEFVGTKGRLIHVFGSAGLRDFTKRPLMGEASGRYADIVILTEEDYRTEDPQKIADQIAQGLEKSGFNKQYLVIIDRELAIKKAIDLAGRNDLIIITGKAHEKSLCRGKIEYPWDEKETVKKLLKKI